MAVLRGGAGNYGYVRIRLEIGPDMRADRLNLTADEKKDWLERPSSTERSNQIFTKSRIKDLAGGFIHDQL